jgi:hypothetical protein
MTDRSAAQIPGDQTAAVYAQQLVERWVGGIVQGFKRVCRCFRASREDPKPQAAATVAAASPRTYNRIFDGILQK